ncbi:hypothetical protein MKW98_024124, partial [Papaver atlanticum]
YHLKKLCARNTYLKVELLLIPRRLGNEELKMQKQGNYVSNTGLKLLNTWKWLKFVIAFVL